MWKENSALRQIRRAKKLEFAREAVPDAKYPDICVMTIARRQRPRITQNIRTEWLQPVVKWGVCALRVAGKNRLLLRPA
jgi:hypothetical protein